MKYFVLGTNGMAGHIVALYLKEQGQQVIGYAKQESIICDTVVGNAYESDKLVRIISEGNFDVVVNCIGILNKAVDADIANGIYINSYFPHFVARCCDDCGCKFIHISSDCVFSGDKSGYVESDVPDPASCYGRTKLLGEVTYGRHLSFRTSFVGPELKEDGIGLFDWFMKQKESVSGYAHVMWSGVTTLELAKIIMAATNQNLSGLYYLSNNTGISKYELLKLFNHYCKKDEINVLRCEEPINSKVLISTRKDFEYRVPDYATMIKEMRDWIVSHKTLYAKYI